MDTELVTYPSRATALYAKRTSHAAEQDRSDCQMPRICLLKARLDLGPERVTFIDQGRPLTNIALSDGHRAAAERPVIPPFLAV